MQTSIDNFGREHLGLKSGAAIEILEQNQEILLRLVKQKSPLQYKGNVLVFQAEAVGDIESALEKDREYRPYCNKNRKSSKLSCSRND